MIYEYECDTCGRHKEVVKSVADRNTPEICECKSKMVRVISLPYVIVKSGNGYNGVFDTKNLGFDQSLGRSFDSIEEKKTFFRKNPNIELNTKKDAPQHKETSIDWNKVEEEAYHELNYIGDVNG